MLIRIARMVRVTFSEKELQMLRPGEFYDVPPSVGRVLVSEGWAIEAVDATLDAAGGPVAFSNEDSFEPRSS